MNPSSVDPSVISKPLAFKGFNVRISSILLVKGRGGYQSRVYSIGTQDFLVVHSPLNQKTPARLIVTRQGNGDYIGCGCIPIIP